MRGSFTGVRGTLAGYKGSFFMMDLECFGPVSLPTEEVTLIGPDESIAISALYTNKAREVIVTYNESEIT